LATGLRSR